MKVPYIDLARQHKLLKDDLLDAAAAVFDHGQFILGPEVAQFETAFAAIAGTKFAIGVDNGTSSLMLLLRALKIGPGDEVITAPNSFVASASSIALVGARPVFSDVGSDMNLDPALLKKAITPRTKAIIAVHWTGLPADIDAIRSVADPLGIAVLEDAAQAVGAGYRGKRAGSLARAASFSLHPLKNLNACGDAGIVTTDDQTIADYLKLARNHGLKNRNDTAFYSPNCRIDTLQAALLLRKLPHLPAWTERRRATAAFYRKELAGLIDLPVVPANTEPVYHTFIIQSDQRDALKAYLAEQGIDTAIHYPIPLHLHESAKHLGYKIGDFPVTERQAGRILSLPVYPELTDEERGAVVKGIQAFFKGR